MGIFKWITSFFSSPAPIVEVKTAPAPKKVVKAEAPKKAVKKTVEPKVAKLTKASLSKLTKAQIEAEGKKFGIDVDKRKTKDVIISEVIASSKKRNNFRL